MLSIIKTVTICGTHYLTLVYIHSLKTYEVQYSNDTMDLLGSDGGYSRKRDGVIAFNQYLKSLVYEVKA